MKGILYKILDKITLYGTRRRV